MLNRIIVCDSKISQVHRVAAIFRSALAILLLAILVAGTGFAGTASRRKPRRRI